MLEVALLDLVETGFDLGHVLVNVRGVARTHLELVGAQARDLAVGQVHHARGVRHDGGRVAGHDGLAVAHADHERARQARDHDLFGIVGVDDREAVRAADVIEGGLDRVDERSLVVARHEVGEHFGVGLAFERDALALQKSLKRRVVLDDAVVNDRDLAGSVLVRVRVGLARPAVRGPARVRDTHGRVLGRVVQARGQVVDASRALAHEHAARVEQRDARAVVPPVFEPAQSLDQDGRGLALANVSHDSAHDLVPQRDRKPAPAPGRERPDERAHYRPTRPCGQSFDRAGAQEAAMISSLFPVKGEICHEGTKTQSGKERTIPSASCLCAFVAPFLL